MKSIFSNTGVRNKYLRSTTKRVITEKQHRLEPQVSTTGTIIISLKIKGVAV